MSFSSSFVKHCTSVWRCRIGVALVLCTCCLMPVMSMRSAHGTGISTPKPEITPTPNPTPGPTPATAVSPTPTLTSPPPYPPIVPFTFSAAEVKPHWECRDAGGQNAVRAHVQGLANQHTEIIVLLQTEFSLPLHTGYAAFGGVCTFKNSDNAVVLFSTSAFSVFKAFSGTVAAPNTPYSQMPWVGDGKTPKLNSSCFGDPRRDGERSYTAAILQHSSSTMICLLAGTFPHTGQLGDAFVDEWKELCQGRPQVIIADTNADGTPIDVIAKSNKQVWGNCSDPGAKGNATCCREPHKFGNLNAHFNFDRTAVCNGGKVESYAVHGAWLCNNGQEHMATLSTINVSKMEELPI